MKILLTGANGYIGLRLLPALISEGHHVVCCVRDQHRFHPPASLRDHISTIEVDFRFKDQLEAIPEDIDAAYYLMHSMSTTSEYEEVERTTALHFRERVAETAAKQVIYLGGISNEEVLSRHLKSRNAVEKYLKDSNYHLTILRAGIIIGSGSASFEIIRDLVEKLPVMITPHWLNTRCQPIAVSDVIQLLAKTLMEPRTFDQHFDIGGPDILTYKHMLMGYAKIRGLSRYILTIPLMTPRLSSYWLYFMTSTSYKLAVALVDSMRIEVVCKDRRLQDYLDLPGKSYLKALSKTLQKIEENHVVSSWKDSMISSGRDFQISEFLQVPTYGCFKDNRSATICERSQTLAKVWSIGGDTGWYFGDWLWRLRGFLDKVVGGVGLRRGRTHPSQLRAGDAVDFWRVLYADPEKGRLLLFAEMKLPGEAWLEFKLEEEELKQIATFRPKGILGRLYWYAVYPLHGIIFKGMVQRLAC